MNCIFRISQNFKGRIYRSLSVLRTDLLGWARNNSVYGLLSLKFSFRIKFFNTTLGSVAFGRFSLDSVLNHLRTFAIGLNRVRSYISQFLLH